MAMTTAAVVRERPILFSGPMVRAILAGSKTQTRRVAMHTVCGVRLARLAFDPAPELAICPYGKSGDRLWVRETFSRCGCPNCWNTWPAKPKRPGHFPAYRATAESGLTDLVWTPSIFMPRWASRLSVEITEVRVERLQDISNDDCRAEGISDGAAFEYSLNDVNDYPRRQAYRALWDNLNAGRGYGWDVNPWVWVVSFARAEVPA